MNATAASGGRLLVSFGGYSTAGRKPSNQDAFAAHEAAPPGSQLKGAVACIADGVSSSERAQQASQTSVTQFIEDYYSTPDSWTVKTAAARVLSSMNAWLYHHGQNGVAQDALVTTFTAIICKSTTAHIFHVGDSRLYRLREQKLEQLTRDHQHRHLGGQPFLTRALGMDSRLEVDYLQEEMQAGDLFLLTSDGLHEHVPASDMQNLLNQHRQELEDCARKLSDFALAGGSGDNVSCLLLSVDELPKQELEEVHRQLAAREIPPVLSPGQSIDGLHVRRVLHSGARSHVYLVEEQGSGKLFALKAPSANFGDDPHYLEAFIREEWVGRRIDDERVMKIYPRQDSSPFLYHLCEYIKGLSLRQWIYDNPRPPLQEVRDLVAAIVSSLRVLQRLGMVHRDLKPENLMLDEQGRIKLIDFGAVRVEGLEELQSPLADDNPRGALDYSAPEEILGLGKPDSDMFSLGVISYELLCGELPFKHSPLRPQRRRYNDWQYRSIKAYRQDLPPWLDLTLQKAVEANPQRRYQAYSEFLQDLQRPNAALLREQQAAPLLERNPLRFWQMLSALLTLLLLLQFYWQAR